MLLAVRLPMDVSTSVSSRGQSSRSRERTRERWVPRLRWIPEHSMQIKAPRFRLAQVGSGERGRGGWGGEQGPSAPLGGPWRCLAPGPAIAWDVAPLGLRHPEGHGTVWPMA